MPPFLFEPREEIRRMLEKFPYNLRPEQALIAAAEAGSKDGEWYVRLPFNATQVTINIVKEIP